MNIAIDCRYLGKSGIGKACEGILDNLDYEEHNYYLIGCKEKLKKYNKAIIIEDESNPYSKKGLFRFNKKRINRECDCIIIPNFIIPFGIKIPVHSVMHDLIFLDIKETVNGRIDYFVKKTLLKRCMKKSETIACVSNFTKSRCEFHFKKYSDKCYVNYNGISKTVVEYAKSHQDEIKENTIIYVGNIKRHKGLKILLEAFQQMEDTTLKLKIIGERSGFITGMDINENDYPNVIFTGFLSNSELYREIQKAKYLVQPSVYEGFGLPPLEALYLGTQPIISDIEVFTEIYSELPVKFFNNLEELKNCINSEPNRISCRDQILNFYNCKKFVCILLNKISS